MSGTQEPSPHEPEGKAGADATRDDAAGDDVAAEESQRAQAATAKVEELDDVGEDFVATDDAPRWLRPLLAFQRAVDALNQRLGTFASYLVVLVVVIGFGNAVLRYIGKFTGQQLTSNRWFEVQWYLYATIFLLAFGYAVKNKVNVRVDFWFAEQSPRRQALIDFVGHLIGLIPFCLLGLYVVWGPVLTSWGARPDGSFSTWMVWEIWERSPDPQGLPRAPVKSLLVVGFSLLLAQALAEMVKLIAELTGHGRFTRRGTGPIRVE